MQRLFINILCSIVLFCAADVHALADQSGKIEKNYFQFMINDYHTRRQSGQVVHINIRYVYKAGLSEQDYPDYRLLRLQALQYMEPSEALPENVYWEILATRIGRDLMHHFPLEGISVQLVVLDKDNQAGNEPSDHGPIFTIGEIEPWDAYKRTNVS